ncbi:glycan-binding surface protein [Flavobacterium sp. WC2509]|uniref:glycan-binding surface protein n=1 Tax=Flavobacterium sp. WC2509 TaxID=3461406 RepID=UPI004044C813
MKNYILNKKYCATITMVLVMLVSMLFNACDNNDSSEGGPITISKVFLEDVNSSVPDREVPFGRLGQLLRIEGTGFIGLKKVYINGFDTYFNVVFVSSTSMLVNIANDTPIMDADPSVRNTIRFVNDSNEFTFSFEVRSAPPVIERISNTLPNVGEMITVYGTGLTEVKKVVFPGNVVVTNGITYDKDGKFFTVTMPAGVSADGGSLLVESANGGVYSPAFFNFKKGVILNFDGSGTQGYWNTTSMIQPTDLLSATVGLVNVSQGKYVPHRPVRVPSFAGGTNRCSEVWTAGNGVDNWRSQLTPFIPASTPLDQVGLQFDIYVPTAWTNTGFLKICLINNFNGGEWAGACYNVVPWLSKDGKVVPFQSTGWTTVTVPLNKFYSYSKAPFTFEDILKFREAASYQNFGFYFENSNVKLANVTGVASEVEFASSATSVDVYTDNWRIVSLKTPTYSDFPN